MAKITEVNDSTFQAEVLESHIPVLVDFWAPWCGPCRMVAPILEEVAQNLDGSVLFRKLNTDENPATAQKYLIMAIPTLLVFRGGVEVDRIIGFLSQGELEKRLEGISAQKI